MSNEDRDGSRRRPDGAAFAIAAGLAVLAAVIAYSTSQMEVTASYARIGPTTFPYVIAFCLFGLSIWTAAEAWLGKFPERESQKVAPLVWIVGGLVAQLLLLKLAGFSIATGLLFAATAAGFGRRELWLTVPLGIALAFFVWIVFAQGLQLSLPAGPLEHLFFS